MLCRCDGKKNHPPIVFESMYEHDKCPVCVIIEDLKEEIEDAEYKCFDCEGYM